MQRWLPAMEAAVDAFPWDREPAYRDWLAQTYYYSARSVPLLGAMMAHGVAGSSLFDWCVRAVGEELHHEQLALADLRALGGSLDEHPQSASCRWLWEPQFCKAAHDAPEHCTGYVLMLESLAATRANAMAEAARQPDASRFLRVHHQKDEQHSAALCALIETFDAAHVPDIVANMEQTARAYIALLADIRARSEA